MSQFTARVDAFLDEFFPLFPVAATATGMHAYDGAWPDLTDAGRAARLAFADRWETELRGFGDGALTADERIDRDLLLSELAALRFDETELRESAWDALGYVYLIGGGIFPLLARDFAPLAVRLTSVASRLEGVRALVYESRRELGCLPDRPPSLLHTEMAIKQLPGVIALAEDAVAQAEAAADQPGVAEILPRLRAACADAVDVLAHFDQQLAEIAHRSSGEGRLGADLYARKLAHTLRSDLTPAEIMAQARVEYDAVRGEMIRIAREIWSQWVPSEPIPTAASDGSQEAADSRTVASVTAAIGKAHHPAGELVEYCRESYRDIIEFIRRRDLITVPDEPLEIDWTPPFLREFAGAMLDNPGPLDKGQKSVLLHDPAAGGLDAGAGRVVPGRGERPADRPDDDPRRFARPLPPARVLEPMPVAGSRDLRQRRVHRGLGRLRDAGDDGRGLTSRTIRR